MASKFALAALALAASSDAAVLRGTSFLGNGMQPEVVARTLSSVQDEWKAQADVFAECDSTSGLPGASIVNCADAPSSFGKSCDTVVNAIVQGSGGDKDVAKEYMSDVCSQGSMSGWHQTQCHNLAMAVRGSMSVDKYSNRMGFDTNKLCIGFWSGLLDGEKKRITQEKADHEAAEKKAAEEAAEEERQQAETRKKEAALKKAEDAEHAKEEAERKKVEEAEHAKEEAEKKAEEAAERVAQKKAEAKEVQEAAKKKLEEAEDAEAEQAVAKDEAAAKAKAEAKAAATKAKPVVAKAAAPVKALVAAPVKAAAVPKAAPVKAAAAPVKALVAPAAPVKAKA